MKDLGIRALSGVIGFLILLGIVGLGGITLRIALLLVSLIGLRELYMAFKNKNYKPLSKIAYISTGIFFLLILGDFHYMNFFIVIVTLALLLSLLVGDYSVEDISLTLMGIFYIPYLLGHIFLLDGDVYIWLIFLIAFGTDIFAYFAGNFFGKHKLAPKISPNKTVEGSLGGILGSLIFTFIYAKLFKLAYIKILPLAVLGSIISQTGDLVASSIKRSTGIKDFGFLIPGHGGILDRFDSIIFTAPVVYYYIKYVII